MGVVTEWMDRRLYPNHPDAWDDKLFRAKILEYADPQAMALDLGAGAGIVAEMRLRGLFAKVCGIDPDPRVVDNSLLDEGKVATGESIPYEDETFDVVFSDNVLEHLAEPTRVFTEVARVLKPGGVFLVKTPNRSHYMPLIARLTPHRFHRVFNRLRGRADADTFPTLYLVNTPKALSATAKASGLQVIEASLHEGRPEYLRLTWITYVFGWMYERLVTRFSLFERFRILMIGVVRKQSLS